MRQALAEFRGGKTPDGFQIKEALERFPTKAVEIITDDAVRVVFTRPLTPGEAFNLAAATKANEVEFDNENILQEVNLYW
jgi:hypothetical protein